MSTKANRWAPYHGSPEAFMAYVRRQLEIHAISQRRVALIMGVDPNDFSRWIRGRHRPTLGSVMRIDAALNEAIHG